MTEKPGPFAHLRPTTIPEMMDRALVTVFRFSPLLWLASFVFAADHLLPLIIGHLPENQGATPALAITLLGLMLLGEYFSALGYLALFQGMLFPRRPLSPKALLRTGLRKLAAYFVTHLLYLTAAAMTILTAYGFFTTREELGSTGISWLAGAVTGAVGLWLIIRLCLAPIVSLIEDCGPFRSFARSMHLTSSRTAPGTHKRDIPALRWLIAASLPITLTIALGAAVFSYGYVALGLRWPLNMKLETVTWSLNLLFFLVMFLAAPLYWSGLMAIYVEYRMRHEALDFYLRLRERRREMNGPDSVSPAKIH